MIADCHMHTRFSTDSETPVHEQIERAISLGMKHICITDHMDMDYPGGEFQLDTDSYVRRIQELQEVYRGRIKVCLGVEIGIQKHLHDRIQTYIHAYPFDFVIGSMHLVEGEDPYYGKIFDHLGDSKAYRAYFRATEETLQLMPKVDTLGHLDYIVRYGREKAKEYSYKKYADEIDSVLRTLIERQTALEVNTAGLRMLGFTNPHPDVIRRYRELGGEMITIGADGHMPERIGYRFEALKALLESCGFRYYTVFEGRKPRMLNID